MVGLQRGFVSQRKPPCPPCGGGTPDEAAEPRRWRPGESRGLCSGTAPRLGPSPLRAQGRGHRGSPSVVTSAFSGDVWLSLFRTTRVMRRTGPHPRPPLFQSQSPLSASRADSQWGPMGPLSWRGGGAIEPEHLCVCFPNRITGHWPSFHVSGLPLFQVFPRNR